MSIRIGRLHGAPINVQPSVAIIMTISAVLLYRQLPAFEPRITTVGRLVVAGFTVIAFLGSILIHELGHALVARRHRVGVSEISLWLFGGVAKLTSQAPTPLAEFEIAVAGPLANIALSAMFGAAGLVGAAAGSALTASTLFSLALVNLLLGATNLIPAAPLDGGRILTAVVWHRLGAPEPARLLAARVGLVAGSIATVVGLARILSGHLSSWTLAITVTAAVVAWAARSEIAGATVRHRLTTTTAGALMVRHPASVSADWSAAELLAWAGEEQLHVGCPVVRWDRTPVGVVVPAFGLELDVAARSWTRVAELMVPNEAIARAWATESIDSVLERAEAAQLRAMVVHDPTDGRWLGTLTDAQTQHLFAPSGLWGRLSAGQPSLSK